MLKPSASAPSVSGELPTVCDQALDIVLGKADVLPPEVTAPIHGAKVAVDSNLRVLISEPSTRSVHILDFANKRYSRIDGAKGNRMSHPYALATDRANNIYVTDLDRGRIAVYSPDGKFIRYIGNFKNEEGLFQHPQAISIDRATNRIYLADTDRDFVLILDTKGKILAQLGRRGGGNGPAEFKRPTDVAIFGKSLFVLDKLNNQIQVLDLDGHFLREFNLEGSGASEGNAMAFDAQGRLFVSVMNWVEVFDQQGKLQFRFGQGGDQQGEFQMAEGICTDEKNRAYIVDSGNYRVQVFQVSSQADTNAEASR
jgi:DNA-binding beta-propeller fold protein YncE